VDNIHNNVASHFYFYRSFVVNRVVFCSNVDVKVNITPPYAYGGT